MVQLDSNNVEKLTNSEMETVESKGINKKDFKL